MKPYFTTRLLATVMGSTVLLGTCAYATDWNVAQDDIIVLYTNDIHCAIEQREDDGTYEAMGFAGLAALKAELAALSANDITLVDAGDAIQGEVLGTLSDGEYLVTMMNLVGYDVAIPGNHEFDYSMAVFLDYAENYLDCGYICSNFFDLTTNTTVLDAYEIISYGDVDVAFVGITTPETLTKTAPTNFQDDAGNYIYSFAQGGDGEELYTVVQTAIDAAVAQGADYVIALGHCGIDAESQPWTSIDIIENVSGLDAFLDGHSHSVIAGDWITDEAGNDVLLTSTGTKFENVGMLTIGADGALTTTLVSAADYTAQDATVAAAAEAIIAENAQTINQVVAAAEVTLSAMQPDGETYAIRSEETNLGDLCTDAYLWAGQADVAIANGGGIRSEIAVGEITYGDIIAVQPYGNEISVVEATGQEILDALEMGAMLAPAENGGFLQVAGMTYTINTAIPSSVVTADDGSFVSVEGAYRVTDVQIGGQALDVAQTYTVASHNYLLQSGGDGINMFTDNAIVKSSVMIDNQALIGYITEALGGVIGEAYAAPQGRIAIVNEAPEAVEEETVEEAPEVVEDVAEDVAEVMTYTIVEGDTLAGIAAKLLGDHNLWSELYELNADVLESADMIHPEQVIVLPM